jgi:DNA-binding SARP family transcriptional activator
MENEAGIYLWDEPDGRGGDGPWQDTIDLLRLVQSDYQGARKQLEKVSQNLAEREALVDQRLQRALATSGGYQTLCLVPYQVGSSVSLMGRTILGGVARPTPLPRLVRLEVLCLGRFELGSNWKKVEHWHSAKAKSVFQYLMTKPREPIIKDLLMEALWSDCDPRAASNNLRAAIYDLRQTLGRLLEKESFPYVLFLQGSYRLSPEVELWVDVEEFERHWVTGRRLDKEGRVAEAIHEYEQAEALYRGDYLEDEPYEEWTLLRREALRDTYVIILSKLADHSMKAADYEGCIVYCQKILARDPCREDAYRRLMCCYSRLGQRNRALRWYEICCRTIQAELDTTPDYETEALHRQLLRNESI